MPPAFLCSLTASISLLSMCFFTGSLAYLIKVVMLSAAAKQITCLSLFSAGKDVAFSFSCFAALVSTDPLSSLILRKLSSIKLTNLSFTAAPPSSESVADVTSIDALINLEISVSWLCLITLISFG